MSAVRAGPLQTADAQVVVTHAGIAFGGQCGHLVSEAAIVLQSNAMNCLAARPLWA